MRNSEEGSDIKDVEVVQILMSWTAVRQKPDRTGRTPTRYRVQEVHLAER